MLSLFVDYPIILPIIIFIGFLIYHFKKDKRQFSKYWKAIFSKKAVICYFIVGVLIVIDYVYLSFSSIRSNESEIWNTLYEHGWIEIAGGIVIFLLLEYKIVEYGEMPVEDGERDYEEIRKGISDSKRTVRIIDNDFMSFFYDKEESQQNVNKENLKSALIRCLNSLEKKQKIEILLLHPNTLAAKQRYDDLQFDISKKNSHKHFDLFKRINTGLMFLHEFKQGLPEISAKRIDIKLFSSTYSLCFASWDQNINFSLFRPNNLTDELSFKTLWYTPLAKYLNDNFDEIWNNPKTIELAEYKTVFLILEDEKIIRDVHWGNDSYDHNLPIFLAIPDDRNEVDNLPLEAVIKVLHDRKPQFASISELIKRDSEAEYIGTTEGLKFISNIYEFAEHQIENKSGLPREPYKIYKLSYTNRRHKIKDRHQEFVISHLKKHGYCFTAHTSYEINLGLHVKKMLNALYDFFIKEYSTYTDEHVLYRDTNSENYRYKRLLTFYTCKENENEIIDVKNHSGLTKFEGAFDDFPHLKFANDRKLEDLNTFLKSTIEADILRISDRKRNSNGSIEMGCNYLVVVHLLQAKVSEGCPVRDNFDDGYPEKKGVYTVLHFVGKRNILGGMPSIYEGGNKTSIQDYNYNSALDSIYIKNAGCGRGEIIVDSGGMSYDKHEANDRIKAAIKRFKEHNNNSIFPEQVLQIKEREKYGFRNLIAIQFIDNTDE